MNASVEINLCKVSRFRFPLFSPLPRRVMESKLAEIIRLFMKLQE